MIITLCAANIGMKTPYKFPHWGPLVIETTAEQEFLDILLEKGNEVREKNLDHRKALAGMIDNEYSYEDYESWFVPKFTPYINLYVHALTSHWLPGRKIDKSWSPISLWINYQKANEYNPPHHHTGDLSFVIYLQVPAVLKNEYELAKGQRKNSGPGTISFDFCIEMPCSLSSFVKLPQEGDVLIFPAWLPHYVHAFKSDVERISVSGNISMRKET